MGTQVVRILETLFLPRSAGQPDVLLPASPRRYRLRALTQDGTGYVVWVSRIVDAEGWGAPIPIQRGSVVVLAAWEEA